MNTIIRVAAAANKIKVADVDCSFENITKILEEFKEKPADIIVFPSLALTSPSCGLLFSNKALLDSCIEAIEKICIQTKTMNSYILIGTPIEDNGSVVSAIAVINKGKIIGYIKAENDQMEYLSKNYSDKILPPTTVFSIGAMKFCVLSCEPMKIAENIKEVAETGCDLIIVPSYSPVIAGYQNDVKNEVKAISKAYGCGIALINGGIGDTTSPYLYRAFSVICECGNIIKQETFSNQGMVMCDLDTDIIRSQKTSKGQNLPFYTAYAVEGKQRLLRPVPMNPYLPQGKLAENNFIEELFTLQCMALKGRLENTGIKKVVLGFSGGLDSTLALLVAAKTFDIMGLDRKNIICLRMPGFASSHRTQGNSEALAEILEVTSREISIENAVNLHFEDIGHNSQTQDITYENAQARERTQIIFDIANDENALALGTGDLSEIALGWCTFGGDQLSGYNVNASITKTLAKKIVSHLAITEIFEGTAGLLSDIVETPISPELVGKKDEITQKTEDILGPYELHEFFLYHLIKYGFRPSKIYYYGCFAFSGILEPAFIKEKLELFIRRFFSSQFKRSCSPDSAVLCDGVFGKHFYMPSDISPEMYIKELKSASF